MRLLAGAAVILALLTFPAQNVQLLDTADHVLKWLFNYLAAEQTSELQFLHFPHGPLAFLQYPIPESPLFYVALVFQSLVRISIAFLFLKQRVVKQLRPRSWSLLALLLFLLFLDFRFSFLFLILLLLEEFRTSKNMLYAAAAALLVSVAFYVRAYTGIISLTAFYSCLLFLPNEGSRSSTRQGWLAASFPPAIAILFWLFLFGSMQQFGQYWVGFLELSLGNSAAVALYPQNVWWLLIPAILLMLLFLISTPKRQQPHLAVSLSLVFLLSLKYALSRQDYGHLLALMQFCCVSGIFLLALNPNPLRRILLLLPALAAFYAAFFFSNHIKNYRLIKVAPVAYISNLFTGHAQEQLLASKEALEKDYRLPKQVFGKAGSIDCYPYNYYPAMYSGLPLSPRPVVQAYAAYTPWLDAQDSLHFSSAKAADVLVWHDNPREDFLRLTGQYLLNEEPKTLLAMMGRYRYQEKEKRSLVYHQRSSALSWEVQTSESFTGRWKDWIPLPINSTAILRLKADFSRKPLGKIKSFLLKETAVFIEYKFADGSLRKFRLNPLNAQSGIWVSPFIDDPFDNCRSMEVQEVRFTALDDSEYQEEIDLHWQFVSLTNASAREAAYQWFSQCSNCREFELYEPTLSHSDKEISLEPFSRQKLQLDTSGFGNDSLALRARVSFEARYAPRTEAYAYLIASNGNEETKDAVNLNRFPLKAETWETFSLEVPVDSSTSKLQLELINDRKKSFEVRNIRQQLIAYPRRAADTTGCN